MRTIEEIKADITLIAPENMDSFHGKALICELYDAITEGTQIYRLEEICNAERDGRCVVLPCKAGDEIYRKIDGQKTEKWAVERIIIFAEEIVFVDDSGNEFLWEDIGETVFLAKKGG